MKSGIKNVGQTYSKYAVCNYLISQDVHSPMPHLSFGTVCLQKSCCVIRNIVLKDILRHSCLIAVTRPSDRYLTTASVAFCRHIWRSINMHIIVIIIVIIKCQSISFSGNMTSICEVHQRGDRIAAHALLTTLYLIKKTYPLISVFPRPTKICRNSFCIKGISLSISKSIQNTRDR